MRIGVVSDTHGHVDHTRPAIRMLESLEVEQVLHCGDIGSMDVVRLFEAWPTHFVFGNTDYDLDQFARDIQAAGQQCHGNFGELELEGVRIALLHSHLRREFEAAVASPRYQVVCYGHTHVAARDRAADGKLVLNPGALYRANRHTIALLDLPACEAEIVDVL